MLAAHWTPYDAGVKPAAAAVPPLSRTDLHAHRRSMRADERLSDG